MGLPKVDEATTIALEAIRDAAPGLLTMTEAAEKVASAAGVSIGTARNRLRAAVEAGGLLELTPWSRKFVIELPGADAAGVGPFYIASERTGAYMADPDRHVITIDDDKRRPSSYGPGRTTYLVDPEQIREYVQQLADEKKAKEQAAYEAEKEAEKAERKEVNRRFPGLNRLLRKVTLLGQDARENGARVALLEADTRLSSRDARDGKDITGRTVHLDIKAWGDANVAMIQSILEAGIAAHIEAQSLVVCKNCDRRILHTVYGRDEFWWHADSSNASCGKDTDTKAEPAEEN
jgi:hypothetical protein